MKLGTVCGLCALTTALVAACGDGSSNDEFSGGAGSAGASGKGGSSSGKGGSSSGKGGNSSAGAEAGGDGNVGDAGATAGGAPAVGGADGSAGSDAQAGATSGGAAAGGAAGTGNCPDVFGIYAITMTDGLCGDLDDGADQELAGTDIACFLHFVSEGALNGGAELDENGEFTGAQLYVGTDQRNPCSSVYDAGDGTMVVTCGGVGDACTVTLERQ